MICVRNLKSNEIQSIDLFFFFLILSLILFLFLFCSFSKFAFTRPELISQMGKYRRIRREPVPHLVPYTRECSSLSERKYARVCVRKRINKSRETAATRSAVKRNVSATAATAAALSIRSREPVFRLVPSRFAAP